MLLFSLGAERAHTVAGMLDGLRLGSYLAVEIRHADSGPELLVGEHVAHGSCGGVDLHHRKASRGEPVGDMGVGLGFSCCHASGNVRYWQRGGGVRQRADT